MSKKYQVFTALAALVLAIPISASAHGDEGHVHTDSTVTTVSELPLNVEDI